MKIDDAGFRQVCLENFRCFRERQLVRLAPLTLLVGENSTGKTSFMALVRALVDLARPFHSFPYKPSIFNVPPYDLGSFDEIVHYRGSRGGHAKWFQAGFVASYIQQSPIRISDAPIRCDYTFGRKETGPILIGARVGIRETWVEIDIEDDESPVLRVGTRRGSWMWKYAADGIRIPIVLDERSGFSLISDFVNKFVNPESHLTPGGSFVPMTGSCQPTQADRFEIDQILQFIRRESYINTQPVASAPVRSKPRRTYDPLPPQRDPEGVYVPMYLANLSFSDRKRWNRLKDALESFGVRSGLFDEITIRHLGKKDSEPFQVQVRKFGSRLKGPKRNLIDMGYGVSQVLPVVTELMRQRGHFIFQLQQPEVHLHPSAQAALGSLFCQVANGGYQLMVETHSDHLLDRVRMDVRDGTSPLKPKDVSILYFERNELDVRIHSLRLDEEGNVLDAPDSYRRFFMEETTRSLGL